MAFSLNSVFRLFGSDCVEENVKPAFDSQRQVYDFCRHSYKKSGGPNSELRQLYKNYLESASHESRDRLEANPR